MFKFSESTNYMIPAHFGGYEGKPPATTYHDVTSILVSYETDRNMLKPMSRNPFIQALGRLPVKEACRGPE
jgi:hypothetical protein